MRHSLALIALLCAGDAFLLEPFALVVTHEQAMGLTSRGTPAREREKNLKIAHLSDLHTKGEGRLEKDILAALDAEKPDVIVISGDTVDAVDNYGPAAEVLAKMHAPLGVYLVHGNWENWRPAKDERGYLAASKAKLLMNESVQIREGIWLAGFDDQSSGAPNATRAMRPIPAGDYVIGLFHSPAFFDHMPDRIQLAFAGHTHGGQVRFPIVGALWRPPGSGRYDNGWYLRDHSEDGTAIPPSARTARMYVSRGLGTSLVPVRFRCSPELAIITLYDDR